LFAKKEKQSWLLRSKALTSSEDFYPEQHFTKEKLNKIIKTFKLFFEN